MAKVNEASPEALRVIHGTGEQAEPSTQEQGAVQPIALSGIDQLDLRLKSAEELTRRIAVSPEDDALKAELALDSAWSISQERRGHEKDALMALQDLLHIQMGPAGYSKLHSEGLIDKTTRNLLNRLAIDIRTLEGHREGKRFSKQAEEKLEELQAEQERLHAELEDEITHYVQEAIGRGGLSKEHHERYPKEMAEFDRVLDELKGSPGVQDILNEWGEDAATRYAQKVTTQREEEFRVQAKERDAERALLKKLEKAVADVGDAQLNAFERITTLAGADASLQNIVRLVREPRAGYQSPRTDRELTAVRDMLVGLIIDGEGKDRVESPAEVVPWERKKSGKQYLDGIIVLRSRDTLALIKKHQSTVRDLAALYKKNPDEHTAALDSFTPHEQRAVQIVEDIIQILHDDEMLRRLVGNKRERINHATKKRIPAGAFWRAFDTRAQNDANGETARRKETRRAHEKRQEEAAQREKAMIQSPYGLRIRDEGVVLLEPVFVRTSRQYVWRVADALGSKKILHELSIAKSSGNTYLKDLSNAPHWLAQAAKAKGL
jgi:hypothetical protein